MDYTNRTFGKLLVLGPAEPTKSGAPRWNVRCRCGVEFMALTTELKRKATTQCKACEQLEYPRPTRGGITHGMKHTPTHKAWLSMRATQPHHGRWTIFTNFYADMGECPSFEHRVERIDPNVICQPGNCRWAVPVHQRS